MSSKIIMFVVFLFAVGTMVSLIIEGAVIGDGEEWDLMQALTGYSSVEIAGAGGINVPKLGAAFILNGLPKVLFWDYSFFSGAWALIKWFILYPISAGVVYAVGLLVFNIATGILGTVR